MKMKKLRVKKPSIGMHARDMMTHHKSIAHDGYHIPGRPHVKSGMKNMGGMGKKVMKGMLY